MKAKKGKSGCLKGNGRLKKGFRWAKGRKGHCVLAKKPKATKRKPAKRKSGGVSKSLKKRVKKAVKDYVKKIAKKHAKKADIEKAKKQLDQIQQEIRVAQAAKEEAEWHGSFAVDGL